MIRKSNITLKVLYFFGSIFVSFVCFAFMIKFAVLIFAQQEAIVEFGSKIDGVARYFTGLRLAIVIGVLFYWKTMVRWYGNVRGLNKKQRYILKAIYPYVAGFILITEVLGFLF